MNIFTKLEGTDYLDLMLNKKLWDLVRERFKLSIKADYESDNDEIFMLYLENKKSKDIEFFIISEMLYDDLYEKKDEWGIDVL